MYLKAPEAVAYLYHIPRGELYRAWFLQAFRQEIADWRTLVAKLITWSTHLAEIVRREPTHMRFYNASIPRAAGMWLNPSSSSYSLVCRHPCLPDIINDLFLVTNPVVNLTNSNLELATLVLHESTLLSTVPEASMAAPRSRSDNTPTILWSMHEASTINPVFAYLPCIRALHSRHFS